jgi:hypothetical protein
MPSEAEILAARLARMKYLIDSLEAQFAKSEAQRELFLKLRDELEAVRAAMKSLKP